MMRQGLLGLLLGGKTWFFDCSIDQHISCLYVERDCLVVAV